MELSKVQYRLWAWMITGVHFDKDTPPQIKNVKVNLQNVKAVNNGSNSTLIQSPSIQQTIQDTSTPHGSSSKPGKDASINKPGHALLGVSPGKVAEIRGKSFGQLKKLYDDCVLTIEEFEEQKAAILYGLKKLND